MADEAGIRIDGRHYAIPSSLRVGETRTIKRLTGLNPPEFMLALNALQKTQDPDVGAAMVWWIVHREDPSFTVEQVDALEWSAIEGEDDAAVVDPKDDDVTSDRPSESRGSSLSSATESVNTSEIPVGETTPSNGGGPGLVLSGPAT